jgi:hypothetical protein
VIRNLRADNDRFAGDNEQMLPKPDDGPPMEQSALNNVFMLCGKGMVQLLQQVVTQQTVIDELRAQTRSLQTQLVNVIASVEDVEDRVMARIQNMQPTVFTREGVPLDDALDSFGAKIQAMNDRLATSTETVSRVDAEVVTKVDRDEFAAVANDTQRLTETFADVMNTVQTIQKDIHKQRQDSEDFEDRLMESVRLQVQSQIMKNQLNQQEADLSNYVTHAGLNAALAKLKVNAEGAEGSVAELAFADGVVTDENVQTAFDALQQKKAALDQVYARMSAQVAQEMARLASLADGHDRPGGEDEGSDSEEDEATETADLCHYIDRWTSTDNDFGTESAASRPREPAGKRRSIALEVSIEPQEQGEDDTAAQVEEVEEVEEVVPIKKEQKGRKKRSREKMAQAIKEQQRDAAQAAQMALGGPPVRVDEGKIVQRVLESVMPKVEMLFITHAARGGGGPGVKFERHEAKQLMDQLAQLDTIRNDVKNLKIKMGMKADRARVENDMRVRITREEFFSYLASLFPENEAVRRMAAGHVQKTPLPPLPEARAESEAGHTKPQGEAATVVAPSKGKGRMLTLRPARNSNMIPLNQKFLRGADGRYYLRDMGVTASAQGGPNLFGTDNTDDVEVAAAMDFQRYQVVDQGQTGHHLMRGQTPMNVE